MYRLGCPDEPEIYFIGVQVTFWVIADMNKQEGQALAYNAMKYMTSKRSSQTRMALIHCSREHQHVPNLMRIIRAATKMASEHKHELVSAFLSQLLHSRGAQARQVMP